MMDNNLQRMFAYQEIMAQRGKESICHSAILRCEHGSERCVLNLPKSHGKYVGTHAQIDIKDGKNAFFGYCRKLEGPCQAELSDWFNGNEADRMFDESTLMMEASVQKDVGFMVCTAARKG